MYINICVYREKACMDGEENAAKTICVPSESYLRRVSKTHFPGAFRLGRERRRISYYSGGNGKHFVCPVKSNVYSSFVLFDSRTNSFPRSVSVLADRNHPQSTETCSVRQRNRATRRDANETK